MKKLSLLEVKKQQWEQERAEMANLWGPWGKPGITPTIRCSQGPPSQRSASLPPLRNSQRTPRNSTSCKVKPHGVTDTSKSNPEKETGDTSGYHTEADHEHRSSSRAAALHVTAEDTNNPQLFDQRLLERKRWMTESFFNPYMWPYHAMPPMPGAPYPYNNADFAQHPQFHQFPWIAPANGPPTDYGYQHSLISPSLPPMKAPATPKWLERSIGHEGEAQVEFVPQETRFSTSPVQTTQPAQSFLRGQKAPFEPEDMAQRELKRRQATELQSALLKQLEEKERKKKAERERRLKEESEEEERLQRQREQEKQLYEQEQRLILEKKMKEHQKQELMEEALLQAREAAYREKLNSQKRPQQRNASPTQESSPLPPTICRPAVQPTIQPVFVKETSSTITPREVPIAPVIPRSSYREVGTSPRTGFLHEVGVQTDALQSCSCGKNKCSEEDDNTAERESITKSFSSQSNRPAWGIGIPKVRYQRQSEKDPKYLQKKRERQRRLLRILTEKQLHGSQPSSDSSGGDDGMLLPSKIYFNNVGIKTVTEHKEAEVPVRADSRVRIKECKTPPVCNRTSSPPVPAVLRKMEKMRLASGEYEKQEYEVPEKWDKEDQKGYSVMQIAAVDNVKLLPLIETPTQNTSNRIAESFELLKRLSMLRKELEKKREDLEKVSLASSDSFSFPNFRNDDRQD